MEKLCFSDLNRPSVDQIGSDTVPEPQAGYWEDLFTLPPNQVSSPDRWEISIVSSNEATVEGEDEEAKRQRLQRNQNCQDRHNNKAAIDQAEEDLRNADGRNPRVVPRHTLATPQNIDDDFVLECDGQNIFATPSANLAAAFEVQRLRKDYSALRAQSNSSRHSTARHHDGNEVNQLDLRANLGNRDVRPVNNDRHRERDEDERERRRRYDEEYGPPGTNRGGQAHHGNANQRPHGPPQALIDLDDDVTGDLDGFSAFSNLLRGVSWPSTFKPVGIDKFDCSVTQQPNESLRDYNKWYFTNRNMITDVDDRDVIHYFHQGLHNIKLWRKMFESNPKTIFEMMVVVNKHADMEDAEKAHCHHKNQCHSDDRPKQRHDDRQRPDG
ncbi:retrotransposon protein, putative, unclassified [Panicum miliaceum]|uniref:Retrotransposon protein, putative, unclassified n=1 Tax=Panicum miliaceum TaxID=4540 RepID=A0A3L6S060_PANMI|nr:retrotransposon protein, putative, unclassified [Panicum miliaceum]